MLIWSTGSDILIDSRFFFLTKIDSRKYNTDASANLAGESWTSEIHIAPIIEYFLNSWERCIR